MTMLPEAVCPGKGSMKIGVLGLCGALLLPVFSHAKPIADSASQVGPWRAFAWTRRNIGRYGGRTDQVFACGHSAGGHLVSLLATDERYLKAEGLSDKDIRGVVSVSAGVRGKQMLVAPTDLARVTEAVIAAIATFSPAAGGPKP